MSPALVLAFFLACFFLWFLYEREGVCPLCSGRGRHGEDCPNRNDGEIR